MVILGQYNPILGVILGQYNPIIGIMLGQYNPILGVILGFIKPKIGFGRTFPVWEIPTEITNITLKFTIFNPVWELKKIPCVVHDASAKCEGGLSFNDVLEKGPNPLPLLWGILLPFRIGKVGVMGDLEKAFLQLTLEEKGRNVCCFLWLNPQGDIQEYGYRKVIFGAKSSPFLLQAVLKYHLEGFVGKSEIASQLLRNLYMDDPVNSVENPEKTREFWHEAVTIFKEGGFNLWKFRSNGEDLLREIADSQVLSLLSKIYDPSGLVSPVVTPLKIIVQDLWKEKVGWDEEVNQEFRSRVEEVLKGFSG